MGFLLRPVLASLLLTAAASLAAPFDALRAGNANTTSPGTVSVPIYLLDAPGTPLGYDRASLRGAAFLVSLEPAPPGLSATLEKAGVLSTITPEYQRAVSRADGAGLFLWLSSSFPVVTHQGYGDQIAVLKVDVPPGMALGSTIAVSLVRSGCTLSGYDGRELEPGTTIGLFDGVLAIGAFWGDATKDGVLDVFDVIALANFVAGNVSPGQPPFLNTRESMNLNPAKDANVDVFDLVLLAGHLVGNVQTLPVP